MKGVAGRAKRWYRMLSAPVPAGIVSTAYPAELEIVAPPWFTHVPATLGNVRSPPRKRSTHTVPLQYEVSRESVYTAACPVLAAVHVPRPAYVEDTVGTTAADAHAAPAVMIFPSASNFAQSLLAGEPAPADTYFVVLPCLVPIATAAAPAPITGSPAVRVTPVVTAPALEPQVTPASTKVPPLFSHHNRHHVLFRHGRRRYQFQPGPG